MFGRTLEEGRTKLPPPDGDDVMDDGENGSVGQIYKVEKTTTLAILK